MELLQPLYDTSFLIKAHLYLQIQSQFYKWENLPLPFFSHISLHVEVWTLRYLALITLPSLFQCSHLVRISQTLVQNRTFLSQKVRKWSDFTLKSLILTKMRRNNA